MTTQEATREARDIQIRSNAIVMTILNDEEFMQGIGEALADEQAGYEGKTIEEIRRDHGLED